MKYALIQLLNVTTALINTHPQDPIATAKAENEFDKAKADLSNKIPIDAELLLALDGLQGAAAKAGVALSPEDYSRIISAQISAPASTSAPVNDGEPTHEAPRPNSGRDRPIPLKKDPLPDGGGSSK